jgi:hypothetical protein
MENLPAVVGEVSTQRIAETLPMWPLTLSVSISAIRVVSAPPYEVRFFLAADNHRLLAMSCRLESQDCVAASVRLIMTDSP